MTQLKTINVLIRVILHGRVKLPRKEDDAEQSTEVL
jgi:hypothetical protein